MADIQAIASVKTNKETIVLEREVDGTYWVMSSDLNRSDWHGNDFRAAIRKFNEEYQRVVSEVEGK